MQLTYSQNTEKVNRKCKAMHVLVIKRLFILRFQKGRIQMCKICELIIMIIIRYHFWCTMPIKFCNFVLISFCSEKMEYKTFFKWLGMYRSLSWGWFLYLTVSQTEHLQNKEIWHGVISMLSFLMQGFVIYNDNGMGDFIEFNEIFCWMGIQGKFFCGKTVERH